MVLPLCPPPPPPPGSPPPPPPAAPPSKSEVSLYEWWWWPKWWWPPPQLSSFKRKSWKLCGKNRVVVVGLGAKPSLKARISFCHASGRKGFWSLEIPFGFSDPPPPAYFRKFSGFCQSFSWSFKGTTEVDRNHEFPSNKKRLNCLKVPLFQFLMHVLIGAARTNDAFETLRNSWSQQRANSSTFDSSAILEQKSGKRKRRREFRTFEEEGDGKTRQSFGASRVTRRRRGGGKRVWDCENQREREREENVKFAPPILTCVRIHISLSGSLLLSLTPPRRGRVELLPPIFSLHHPLFLLSVSIPLPQSFPASSTTTRCPNQVCNNFPEKHTHSVSALIVLQAGGIRCVIAQSR